MASYNVMQFFVECLVQNLDTDDTVMIITRAQLVTIFEHRHTLLALYQLTHGIHITKTVLGKQILCVLCGKSCHSIAITITTSGCRMGRRQAR